MAHPALASSALYRVKNLPIFLEKFGFSPNGAGYERLRTKHTIAGAPTSRTVQDMLARGDYAKHSSCLGIAGLINAENRARNFEEVEASKIIEEHEYRIRNLQAVLLQAGRVNGSSRTGPLKYAIADLCNAHHFRPEWIDYMCKGRLTTRFHCEKVGDAIRAQFGIAVEVTNEPPPPTGRRILVAPIPGSVRGPGDGLVLEISSDSRGNQESSETISSAPVISKTAQS